MLVYHRICLDIKQSKLRFFRLGRELRIDVEEEILFRVEYDVFAGEDFERK